MPKVTDVRPQMGCDPEFFFKKDGEIVGAEKFIPKDGIVFDNGWDSNKSKFIIDGVQAELNPRPNNCRANLANEIKACFQTLKKEMAKKAGEGFTLDFSRAVEISKDKLMELDEKSRKFGCAPSKSVYRNSAGVNIAQVDPSEYRVRAAGGHIHIGFERKGSNLHTALVDDCVRTVKMLDILVGNTCVLVDRDPANIERRKVYGRAGEYRLPPHGLEYRTLSNFWLTSYPLMSMAFGLARLAVQLMADNRREDFYEMFTSEVRLKDVHTAINNNDFDLAMANFKAVEKLIIEVSRQDDAFAIHGGNMPQFYHFVDVIKSKGLEYWFPEDPMTHWTKRGECHVGGFHDYLLNAVAVDLRKSTLEKVKVA